MAQAIPTVQGGTLLYQHNGQDHELTIGTAAWYSWLSTATTFAFTSAHGTFTARKERPGNQRGGWYWKAYCKQQGKLHRAYLGKSEVLTLGRLNAVARALASPSSMPEQGDPGKEKDAPRHRARCCQSPRSGGLSLCCATADGVGIVSPCVAWQSSLPHSCSSRAPLRGRRSAARCFPRPCRRSS